MTSTLPPPSSPPCSLLRSPKLSSRHYLDTQRIANRVWSSHFRHKANIRGKVVETFEQLSTQADVLASKAKTATEQLQRTKVWVKLHPGQEQGW